MRLYEIICSLQVYNVGRGHFCLRSVENTQNYNHMLCLGTVVFIRLVFR